MAEHFRTFLNIFRWRVSASLQSPRAQITHENSRMERTKASYKFIPPLTETRLLRIPMRQTLPTFILAFCNIRFLKKEKVNWLSNSTPKYLYIKICWIRKGSKRKWWLHLHSDLQFPITKERSSFCCHLPEVSGSTRAPISEHFTLTDGKWT